VRVKAKIDYRFLADFRVIENRKLQVRERRWGICSIKTLFFADYVWRAMSQQLLWVKCRTIPAACVAAASKRAVLAALALVVLPEITPRRKTQ